MTKSERMEQAYRHDLALWEQGLVFAGIDEAGRGPLAGCVTAACVVMQKEPRLPNIYDSKHLSEKQRSEAFERIREQALFVGVGHVEADEIDRINILEATRLAMRKAAAGAPVDTFLVDAVADIGLSGRELPLIGGDAASYSIAAASIIAKVTRDRLMQELDAMYPAYGFARHKGYGTRQHMDAIRQLGPCPAHRKTFLTRILAP
ncbi:MAG: ribonuclease HII [Clostridiales bacterium]|nr:ribonuclease HII [Clostridiales bacterium]